MQKTNKHGVPIWMIKRALICRVNLCAGFRYFEIDQDGNILLDNKNVSHIDRAKWDVEHQCCYIPLKKIG